jgi:predicted aspartyl protease
MHEAARPEQVSIEIVPDPEDPTGAELWVEAELNGVPTPFLLDTGARRTTLARSSAVQQLPRTGTEDSGGVFGSVAAELVRVAELRFGPVVIADAEVAVHPAGLVRNVLGMDVLGLQAWELRFSDATLRFDRPPAKRPGQALARDMGGHLYVDVSCEAASVVGVWDTGAGITVLDQAFARVHADLLSDIGTEVGTDVNGTAVSTPVATLAPCRIGGLEFASSRIAIVEFGGANATVDRHCDAILGYPLLSQADWYFDPRGGHWSVARR